MLASICQFFASQLSVREKSHGLPEARSMNLRSSLSEAVW